MSSLSETDRLFFGKSDLDPVRAQRLVREALSGMDDGELFLETSQSEGLVWDDGKLRSASFDASQGFGLRAISGETVGFAHAADISEKALGKAVSAVKAVRAGREGTLELAPRRTNTHIYDDLNPLEGHPFEAKVSLLQEIDAYVRSKSPFIRQVSVSVSASWQAVQIIRAEGEPVADIRPLVRLNVSVVTERDGRMESGTSGRGGRTDNASFFEPEVWHSVADEALRKALLNLESIEAPAGECTVVLGHGWPAVLLHEAIGHGLEGDFHRKKTSAFTGRLGERIAAKGVTIVDDGTLPDRRGSLSVDDEGTPSQCTTLVEDGILIGLMQDRMNARLMGMASTGNGRREDFTSQPYPRMTNTFMRPGSLSHDDILSSVKKGVYAADFGGGQVDITSGKFVFTATEAYEIENGKIGRPLKGASLVGSGAEVLQRITMIGNDLELDRGVGTCGKNGQSVPVGVGQPTLKLEDMTVGGSGGK